MSDPEQIAAYKAGLVKVDPDKLIRERLWNCLSDLGMRR